MKVANIGKQAQGAELPTHEKTGLFFPQFVPVPGPLAGQMQLMLVPGSGIPMRDHFASHALFLLCPNIGEEVHPEDAEKYARDAYRIADAMMKARQPEKVANGFPYTDGDL